MKFLRETGYLFVRGLKQSLRPWPALIPSLFLPAFFLIVYGAAFKNINSLPGFDAANYLVFYAPVAILQAIFFGSGDAGIDLVVDITSGYFDKLLIAPIRPLAIVLGKLLAVALRAAAQAAIVVVFILLLGGRVVTGIPGFLMILLLSAFFGMAWSGVGMTIALLTKNQRATQSAFILFFPFTFITTAQLPLHLLSGWYRTAVLLNPVTYVLEALRSLTTNGWNGQVIAVGFLASAGVALATISATLWAFRRVTRYRLSGFFA
jgi:ABC-2 type transport system permease protein